TRASAPTPPSTNLADAPAAPPSAGTRTRPRESVTPTSEARCSPCTGKRRHASGTPCSRGRNSPTTPRYPPGTSEPAARAASCGPIPAVSMVAHGVGARFMNLIGGTMQAFYDWYADLAVASPQVFDDQTDVPESADGGNASDLMMWGWNVPVTRTADAHFMT